MQSPAASQRRQHRRKRRGIGPGSTRMRAPLTSISIIPRSLPGADAMSSLVCAGARQPGLPSRRSALGSDPDRHKAWRVNACRRELVSPHREQPTDNAIQARDLGNVGAFLEALRYDPGLLLRRPSSPAPLSGNHLDTTIGESPSCLASSMAFAIDPPPNDQPLQAVSQINRATARWGPHAGYRQMGPTARRRRDKPSVNSHFAIGKRTPSNSGRLRVIRES